MRNMQVLHAFAQKAEINGKTMSLLVYNQSTNGLMVTHALRHKMI